MPKVESAKDEKLKSLAVYNVDEPVKADAVQGILEEDPKQSPKKDTRRQLTEAKIVAAARNEFSDFCTILLKIVAFICFIDMLLTESFVNKLKFANRAALHSFKLDDAEDVMTIPDAWAWLFFRHG